MKPEITYWSNGKKREEIYKNAHGEYHRLDGPAYRRWHETGQLCVEEWQVDGQHHRIDGPADRVWYANGQLMRAQWFFNDRLHRPDGPALLIWGKNGQLEIEEWYIWGKETEPWPLGKDIETIERIYK